MSNPDSEKLIAALEELEAERRRRTAEKFETGELHVRVIGVPSPHDDDDSEVFDDEGPITTIVTGVPRRGRDADWKFKPNQRDPTYRPQSLPPIIPPTRPMPAPRVEREPLEWTKVQTQVSPPDERSYRSVITVPLITSMNVVIGCVSNHFVNVHRPTMIETQTLKSYSKMAAEHLYRLLDDAPLKDKALSMNHKLYAEAGY